MLSAILLAAGESKRMGSPKQLIPWGQSTMVETSVDNLLASDVNEVIVVLGYQADEIEKVIDERSVKIAVNQDYEQGMSTSIITGLKRMDSRSQAIMLALGDQPLIDCHTINKLIEGFCNANKGIAVPTYIGKRGHPVIFARKYKEELMKLSGDIGGRQIIKDHPEDVLEVAVDCEGICIDFDTVHSLKEKKPVMMKNTGG